MTSQALVVMWTELHASVAHSEKALTAKLVDLNDRNLVNLKIS